MRSTGLNHMFIALNNKIKPEDYLNSVKAFFLLNNVDSYEFPDDDKFARAFASQEMYGKLTCRFILCRLETWNTRRIVTLDGLSVEHVFPVKPKRPEWGVPPGELLDTVGNLTLAHWKDNAALSNKPFAEKLKMDQGYRKSGLSRLNEDIVNREKWGEEEIRYRGKELAKLALKVWPYPRMKENEIAPFSEEPEPERSLQD
ncbi:MAG: HNH endonuclease family protein [Deltaproteobacteria bacterium]|jgi:hypothetical protein|nr:HNH endonuclease family protein [Deltaproteobacteria bacterium]